MTSGPVLIAHARAEALRARLSLRFPDQTFLVADGDSALRDALAENPVAALTIKVPEFGVTEYAKIIDAPSMRWVFVGGSGYEHIGTWDPRRVSVTNCVGVLAPFLADTCMGAILSLNQRLLDYREDQRERRWQPKNFTPLASQTLLVVGVGAIGGALAERAKAFGMRVIGVRRSGETHPSIDEMYGPDALLALLGNADVVSVHLRLTDETRGVFDARAFATMKDSALFLNTSRGGCVVEPDLIRALETGALRGAYLDVFETEPLPDDAPIWRAPNLLISPHASDSTVDWEERFCDLFATNLERWRSGANLINVVAP